MVTLCRTCHVKVNHHEEDFVEVLGRTFEELGDAQPPVLRPRKPRLVPKPVRIVDISYAGEQITYDIEMEEPYHNFVADGMVTHNSQRSQRSASGRMLRFVEPPDYLQADLIHSASLA